METAAVPNGSVLEGLVAMWLPRPAFAGIGLRTRALTWAGAWHPPTLSWVPAVRAFGAYETRRKVL